ncbi:Spindle associated [Ophiocordyceps sinensis CO18]|uniref:Spindle associated n=1 Tax=Ophiocordyceps sinensis (strain Co18 / CGMCC 3.14243) TaxID=911162 RepID=T5AAN7_OPHSC|nr:Spindle associated [Ophiocordyceps sinensis CO18]
MAPPGFGGALDTPRTNIGDATYLSRPPDFADVSQEASFQSPGKDGNLLQQLRNGRSNGHNLRTPRQRGPLTDRRNLPLSVGGAEFTPLLKSATRNSVRQYGKENGAAVQNTPALDRIEEDDMTPVPRLDTSAYLGSRNQSYLDNTLPQVDSSSVASTPAAMQIRRGKDKGPLQDGNQLSLREQENVIDRIEKENFGLKLKIHFLEEALRKAGPGFSEAALKENTELKVDKVTMQRELHRYKKHVTSAERDLESYRRQMMELQDKAKRKHSDEGQGVELEELRKILQEREADMIDLQHQLDQSPRDGAELGELKDDIEDLEADLREKDRIITEHEDELEDLRDRLENAEDKARDSRRLAAEMEKASSGKDLEEAKETIQDLEQNIRRLEEQVEDMKVRMDEGMARRERAEQDLQELQEDMADKSVVAKGLSRQFEDKFARLQKELDRSSEEYAALEKELGRANEDNAELKATTKALRQESEVYRQDRESDSIRVQELEAELLTIADERDLLQSRHGALSKESSSLEQDVERLERKIQELEESLSQEREYALETEKDLRNQYSGEIARLNDEVSRLQAEIREKDNLYDNDSEKWENQMQTLESERDRVEEKATGLQRTIDRLRQAEGNLSDKESKLMEAIESETERHKSEEAIMTRQIDDLQDALDTRQGLLVNLRNELSSVREELRQTQIDYQSQVTKVVALEDEVEVLQTSSATRGNQELESVKRECDKLRGQLSELQRQQAETKRGTSPVSERGAQQSAELTTARLRSQLSDVTFQLKRAADDQQSLKDQLATLKVQLHSSTTSLAEARAERDELDDQLGCANSHENDTPQVDQERLDLRTAKMKLDSEVRRLRDENRALTDQRASIEKTLEDEFERAAAEDERLRQEVVELQAKLRQTSASESQDLATTRRTVRELERRIEDYQMQLVSLQTRDGGDNSSDLSMIRKHLSASRQKELEFLQRDSAHRNVVKGLRSQIADLERQLHDDQVLRLTGSPGASPTRNDEGRATASELRAQLSTAQRSVHEWESRSRDSEHRAAHATQDLQRQLSDLEDQKLVLEEVLEEARLQAEETAAQHEKAMRRMQHKLDQAERGREAAVEAQTANSKQHRHLRKSQAEVENLEHDVRQQQDLIDGLVAAEASLRRKLDRARSERAAYRVSAEKLQRDIQRLQTSAAGANQAQLTPARGTDEALETVVRAAQGAERRHEKELRGMVMQVEWMQARWEREASLRSDAAYAKRFLQLQLDVASAWLVLPPPLPFSQRGQAADYFS